MPGRKKNAPAVTARSPGGQLDAKQDVSERPLRERVRHALEAILDEDGAPAGARASAGRTLLEFFGEDPGAAGSRSIDTMNEVELNRAIEAAEVAARLQQGPDEEG
jgi:hypothetical protein